MQKPILNMTIQKRQEWSNALRSGEFKQTTGKLYDPVEDSYCCLGVYAEITPNLDIINKDTGYGITEDNTCPYDLLNTYIGNTEFFWGLNDSGRKSFLEIADIIDTLECQE